METLHGVDDDQVLDGAGNNHEDFTPMEQKIHAIAPRVSAAISFLSSTYIVVTVLRKKQLRSRIYHRLMFGTAIEMMIMNIGQLWGTGAVPRGTPNVYGAYGTDTTCSIQGFIFQFGYVVPSYYCALSLYSFVAVTHNFQLERYAFIEKWIHIGVYVFPLLSALYLLSEDAFNYAGHNCWIASVPLGCGGSSYDMISEEGNAANEECTRGPQDIERLQWLLGALPVLLLLFVPTVVMVVLYVVVRRHQSVIIIEARTVAKQASLYLLALYWTYSFSFIHNILLFVIGKNLFWTNVLACVVENLLGLWILLVYVYVRQIKSPTNNYPKGLPRKSSTTQHTTTKESSMASIGMDNNHKGKMNSKRTNNLDPEQGDGDESNRHSPIYEQSPRDDSDMMDDSYSIFDGRNPSEVWSNFIFEGDDDDESADRRESMKWESVLQT